MAIVPTKDNFQVAPNEFKARVTANPARTDVTANGRFISKGLMALGVYMDEQERIEAADEANKYARFLDEQQLALSERKGYNAFKNEDGSSVMDSINRARENYISKATLNMSSTKREKFNALRAQYDRNFDRTAGRYIQGEYQSYQKATLDNTKAQYAKSALMNYAEDPEETQRNLVEFRNVAMYQAKMNGADDSLASSQANNEVSSVIRDMITDSIDKDDLKTANSLFDNYKKVMTAEDLLKTNEKIRERNSVQVGEDWANKVYSAGIAYHSGGDMSVIEEITVDTESGGRDFDENGKLLVSKKGALGRFQIMPETAKNPGYGIKPAKDLNDPEELARVGKEYLAAMLKEFDGDLQKAWAAYNWGVGNVEKAIKEYGDDWLSHAPEETKNYVAKNINQYEKKRNEPLKLMSEYEVKKKAEEVFANNESAKKAAIDSYSKRKKEAEAFEKQRQEDTLNKAYDMIDSGKTLTEVHKSGVLSSLDSENARKVTSYAQKNAEYDYDLLAELENNPEKLIATNLGALRGILPRKELNRLAKMKALGQTKEGRNMLSQMTIDMRLELEKAGINLNSKKEKDIEAKSNLNDYLWRSLELYMASNKGAYPKDPERLAMIQKAIGEVYVPKFLGFGVNKRRFEMTDEEWVASLSHGEKNALLNAANAARIKGTDEQKIIAVLNGNKGAKFSWTKE